MLEIEVAPVLLGLALTGLFPLVTIHCRGLTALEQRVIPNTTAYLVPAADPSARNLGASASIVMQTGTSATPFGNGTAPNNTQPPAAAVNNVQILSFQHTLGSQVVSAQVSVNPVPP